MWFPCCCCRFCPHCADGFAPRHWRVDITGLAAAACNDCTLLNASYILDSAGTAPLGGCQWELLLPAAICHVQKVRLTVGPWVMQGWPIVIDLLDADDQFVLGAHRYYSSEPGCWQMQNESLGSLSWWLLYPHICDVSQSQARITALRPCAP